MEKEKNNTDSGNFREIITLLKKALAIYIAEGIEREIENEEYELYKEQYPFNEHYYFKEEFKCEWEQLNNLIHFNFNMEDGSEGIVFPNGDRYFGESLKNNEFIPHGLGICYYADGRRYEGEWMDGVPNGKGTIHLSNGEGHGGEWVAGELMEKTTKISINGDCYIGEFKDDFYDGEGMLTKAKGKIYKGKFSKG